MGGGGIHGTETGLVEEGPLAVVGQGRLYQVRNEVAPRLHCNHHPLSHLGSTAEQTGSEDKDSSTERLTGSKDKTISCRHAGSAFQNEAAAQSRHHPRSGAESSSPPAPPDRSTHTRSQRSPRTRSDRSAPPRSLRSTLALRPWPVRVSACCGVPVAEQAGGKAGHQGPRGSVPLIGLALWRKASPRRERDSNHHRASYRSAPVPVCRPCRRHQPGRGCTHFLSLDGRGGQPLPR